MADQKVLLVGWDAADWKIIHVLMDRGLMPHTKQLVETGVMANLATLSPVLSPMLWTSIATGKRPYKHGILGFSEPTSDGTAVQPVTNLSRKTKAVWNILNQVGKRSLVVGWWPSHPAEPINGVMVSNHYQKAPRRADHRWPMAAGTVHPPDIAEELANLRVHPTELTAEHIRPFIPKLELIDQESDRRVDGCLRTLADCTTIQSCATHLLDTEEWDFAAVYFDSIDHFCHGFMRYHPPRRPAISEKDFELYQNVVSAGYVYHDMMLGRLLELAGEDTTVILMSDHGFHPDHLRPGVIPMEPAGPAIEHRDFGILVVSGPGIKSDQLIHSASLLDITPTILTMFGLAIGDDMDGRPLLEAFEDEPHIETIASWDDVDGEDGRHPSDRKLDPDMARESLEQLVALGYIERPADDGGKAVAQTNRELHYNLALAYIDGGRHPKAAELLSELYRDYPLEFRFGVRLAICLQAMGMMEDMVEVVDSLKVRWAAAAKKARSRLKEISVIAKQRRKEQDEREQASESDADESPQTGQRPRLFSESEKKTVDRLRAIARGNERTLDYLHSVAALASNDTDRALEYLAEAEKSESKTPGFFVQMGNAYLELNLNDDATRHFTHALELDSLNPSAHIGLCRSQLKRRRHREALESARTAVGLKYHFPAAHYYLGVSMAYLGNLEGATRSLQCAIDQNPNFPQAHRRLARVYARTDQKDLAHLHRSLAKEIREVQKMQSQQSTLCKLAKIDEVDFDDHLPKFEEAAETPRMLPPLGAEPVAPRSESHDHDQPAVITVVSGLPRSGTSMMMQMLRAGGLEIWTDGVREADPSNPRGYYELERIKQLATDNTWLAEAQGKVIKVVAPLIPYLPQHLPYRLLFMEREVDETIASQTTMLQRSGYERESVEPNKLRNLLMRQIGTVKSLARVHHVPIEVISYREVLNSPAHIARGICQFLGQDLDIDAMASAVDRQLYRERTGNF